MNSLYIKSIKWMFVHLACLTMVFTPVAMGQEAKRVSKAKMQTAIDMLGLNRQMTVGEFYQKNKYLFPPRIQKQIEPMMTAFKNQMMPTFEVLSSKTTSGEEIATVRASQGSELLNVQWFGESERMFKFQNTNISEIDVINFDDMFTRIIASDEKYRKQIEPKSSKKISKTATRPKYPDVTKAEWKTMSDYNKASYVVNLRLLLQDARNVLRAKEALGKNSKKNKKTSEYFLEKNKHFFALFFGQDVEAAAARSCIVAGYVSEYRGSSCSVKGIDKSYEGKENTMYIKARNICAQKKQMACNPYVFGTPGGSPTCVTPQLNDSNFQTATHWDGPCDSNSRLSNSQSNIPTNKKITSGRYEDGNLLPDDERRKLFSSEQGKDNYRLTEDYLLGILKFQGKVGSDVKKLVIDDEILEQIKKDKIHFDAQISAANASCKQESEATSKNSKIVHEKNYWQACDQLHSRYLFIDELLAAKCGTNTFNPKTLKCTCSQLDDSKMPGSPHNPTPTDELVSPSNPGNVTPANPGSSTPNNPGNVTPANPGSSTPNNPGNVTPANPGSSTPSNPGNVTPANPGNVTPANPGNVTPANPGSSTPVEVCPGAICPVMPAKAVDACASKYPGAEDLDEDCKCSNGKRPRLDVTDVGSEQEAWSCESSSSAKAKEKCDFWCTAWKGFKSFAPFLVLGVAAYALFKLLAPVKPKLNPPSDLCPNTGRPAPCAQICVPPLKNQPNGQCSCDGCPPGQVANPITCFCSTGIAGPVQNYPCPASAVTATDLVNCRYFDCPTDGKKYLNPLNCPPKPPAVKPAGVTQ